MAENKPSDAPPPVPAAPQTVRPMTPDEIRAAEAATQAQIVADVAERDPMNGPDGGRYKVGDDFVDAEGKPIGEKK